MQNLHASELVLPASIASEVRGMHPNDAVSAALGARKWTR